MVTSAGDVSSDSLCIECPRLDGSNGIDLARFRCAFSSEEKKPTPSIGCCIIESGDLLVSESHVTGNRMNQLLLKLTGRSLAASLRPCDANLVMQERDIVPCDACPSCRR